MKRNSVQTSFAFSPESRYINLYNIVDQRQEPEKLQLNWEKLKPKKWNGFLNHSTEKESPGFEQLIQIDKSACGYFSRLTCWLLWYEREIKERDSASNPVDPLLKKKVISITFKIAEEEFHKEMIWK